MKFSGQTESRTHHSGSKPALRGRREPFHVQQSLHHLRRHHREPASKANNPAVPITIAEQIGATQEAMEAGASIVHAHVRNDDETPSSDPEKFGRLLEGLRKHCPGLIVQFSTGGRSGAGRERGGMLSLRPDMASLSVGSNNFPTRVYENSPELVDWLAAEMRTYGVKPEIEAFDLSHIFGGCDGEGRAPRLAALCPVRHGREECDAGRSPGLRLLHRDAQAPCARRRVVRRRDRAEPDRPQRMVRRRRRTRADRPGGQPPPRPHDSRPLERRAGQARRGALREVRTPRRDARGGTPDPQSDTGCSA